nr:unnamed protein product [Callosobruchus analis]
MSKHYTAYQYEAAYRPQALRNWEVPKFHCDRPFPRHGRTSIIANSRGHLLPGVFRPHNDPWGNYLGTWEMPKYIDKHTANILNGTIAGKEKIKNCKRRLFELSHPKEHVIPKVPQEEAPVVSVVEKPLESKVAEKVNSKAEIAKKVDSKTELAEKFDSKEQLAEKPVEDEAPQEPQAEVKKPGVPCPIHDLYDAAVQNKS